MYKQVATLLTSLASFLSLASIAGEYPVADIPKPLLKNANAVIRKQEQVVEIHSLNKVVIKDHYVITILNEAGEDLAYWTENYSNLKSINHVEGNLFDALGNKLRTVRKNEIKDQPVSSSMTMVDDDRIKYHNFYYKTFPYTVEYSSEVTKSESMILPNWAPLPGKNISVEKSSFTVIAPINYEVRARLYQISHPAVVSVQGKTRTSTWSVNAMPAIAREYAAPAWHEIAPYISFGPTDFKLGDYSGSMRSWKEYGQFISTLNSGLVEIPQATRAKVAQLVAGLKTEEEKVMKLYSYMQSNTHYIGIQLGIGGWKPFPASYVAEKGYGDCKALSNYMIALLKEAGIRANYVLISAGDHERDIILDFPASQFNHAICFVPLAKDTIWLECTSQTQSAGYMGGFTGNRHGLAITENGGVLVTTPYYTQLDNLKISSAKGIIDTDGKLHLNTINQYQAECSDDLHGLMHTLSKEDQLKYLKKNLDLVHYDIQEFSFKESSGKIPLITETYSLEALNYAQVTGKRMFLMPNILNRSGLQLTEDSTRLYPIELREELQERDTVIISLPPGYKPEFVPKPSDIQTPFGKYQSSVILQGDQLIYYRYRALYKGKFPAGDYPKLVRFNDQVLKADRAKLVLVKAE